MTMVECIDEKLVARVRGEYNEMPGLRLTPAQARRLWQMDTHQCEAILDHLVQADFLIQTRNGAYAARSGATEQSCFCSRCRSASS